MRRYGDMTLARLAGHLGLSEGTVSRALNNYPDIAPKTRERVSQAAQELGYQASAPARRLARGVIETIGFVLPGQESHVSETFLSQMLDGVASELARHDWDLIVAAVPEGGDERDVADRLMRLGKVSGFIVARPRRQDPMIDFLLEARVPLVVHGRTDAFDRHSWVDFDNEKSFLEAVRHLVSLGHSRIAYIGGDLAMTFAELRRRGYVRGMEEAGLDIPEGYVVNGIRDGVSAEAAMSGILKLPELPTAIVCVTDALAIGAMRAIAHAGLKPGHDISVIGYDGAPFGLLVDPPLTTIMQPNHLSGQEAARIIRTLVESPEPQIIQKLWDATLVPRASTNPPPKRRKRAR